MEKQVNKDSYNFSKYCTIDRWASYWHQIDEITKINPESVLEIGLGDGVLSDYLKNNTCIKYKSMDIAEDLQPDIVGSIDSMKNVENEAFDLVCAFEVIEHLPFEKFEVILDELKRVSRKWVLISLPHWGRHFSFEVRLPYFKKKRWQFKLNLFPIEHKFNGQHYWEIGKSGYNLDKIKKTILDSGFKIESDYIAFESPYHHFFILEK